MLVCGKILVNICASQSVDNNKLMNHLLLITYVIIVERILKVCNLPNPLPIFCAIYWECGKVANLVNVLYFVFTKLIIKLLHKFLNEY